MSQKQDKICADNLLRMHEIAAFLKRFSREHAPEPHSIAPRLQHSHSLLRTSISLHQSKQHGYASDIMH